MSQDSLTSNPLVELYYRYVGEPERMRDVYGYWLFLVGTLAGLVGVLLYLFEQGVQPGNLDIREVAIVFAAVGLALALFGIVVLLPVRRRGIGVSILGLLIAIAGIGAFTWAYPSAWYVPPDYSPEIIAVYTTGIGIIAAVAVLVPIVTGEKALLVKPELGIGRDEPPILLGQAVRDAFFAIYETPTNEWTWRIIERDAIAESADTEPTDTDARLSIESIKDTIGSAQLLDITAASFRLYRTPDDEWQWSLVRQDGNVVARSAGTQPDRDAVESQLTFLAEQLPAADIVEITGGAFDVFEDESERWDWRFVDDSRRPLATDPDTHATESDAIARSRDFADRLEDARVLALEEMGVELYETELGWQYRIVDADDDRYATSEGTGAYDTRSAAESAATQVVEDLATASIIDHDEPAFECVPDQSGWTWTLRDDADDRIATRTGEATSIDVARDEAERTQAVLPEAEIIEYEDVDYEVYPTNDGWGWRLVSEDRRILAEHSTGFEDREAADEAVRTVQDRVLSADLIEFDSAAFQQYESDGEWRWRLIDEDGRVMTDSGEGYDSKVDLREGMQTLKEHAPDAEMIEIETAAFEIYLTENDTYAWRLIDEGGHLIADGATTHGSREAARDAVEFILDHVAMAEIRPMQYAAFQLHQVADGWTARLIDFDGTVLADVDATLATRDDTITETERIQEAASEATIEDVGPVTVQLRNGSTWRYQLITPERDRIATGERSYDTRDDAVEDAQFVIDAASEAPTFDLGDGAFWVHATDGEWKWRLVDSGRTVYAVSPETYDTQNEALETIDRLKTLVPEAGSFEIETLAFEIVRGEDGLRWRLLDAEETHLADSPTAYDLRDELDSAIDRIRETAGEASILEIDEASFEFHQRDDGWVWRLVDENGAPLAEGVQVHDSRQTAREEMLTAKEYGPDGETVVTW